MPEPLKASYGPQIPTRIATAITAVHPSFPAEAFLANALTGYDELELMPRGRHIGHALHRHLPQDFEAAVEILLSTLDGLTPGPDSGPMAVFVYMPLAFFVGEYGLEHFEASMRAQHEITQRFTAEFSIRPFLLHHTDRTLERLHEWASDPSHHVRRLVSEGTRPRLPWAIRLPKFQKDPTPVLALLEQLKDDPELYVRRSVANNLNDIGKDNPEVLIETARRWYPGASNERQALVRHALRSLVKAGHPEALEILGFAAANGLAVKHGAITPSVARSGERIAIEFDVVNESETAQRVLVDFRIHYIKANGSSSAKVFKLTAIDLAPGQSASLRKTVSLAEMTTRKHFAGIHRVEALLNGQVVEVGSFELVM